MDTHMRDGAGVPVCQYGITNPNHAVMTSSNIDDVTCVDCLRAMLKDAVRYGRDRKPNRQW